MSFADEAIWHQIHLDRYTKGIQREMNAALLDARDQVIADLKNLNRRIEAGVSQAFWTQRRLEMQLAAMNSVVESSYNSMNADLAASNAELVDEEIEWNSEKLAAEADQPIMSPTPEQVYSAVTERPFEGWRSKSGAVIYSHDSPLRNVPKKHQDAMERAIRNAWLTGRQTRDTAKQVDAINQAIADIDYSYDVARRNVATEVRTGIQTYAMRTREETFNENADLFPWVEYVATLDNRVTEICAALDGRVYRVDDPNRPNVPQHWNCRSTYAPKETKNEELNRRPSVEPTENYQRGDNLTKSGKVRKLRQTNDKFKAAQQKGNTKFNDWLIEQDKKNPDFVKDYFKSEKRYEAWKAGKLGRIQYTNKDGKVYNINNLKRPPV